MVTTSKATLALILVALVGCGPKPALHLNEMTPATGVYTLIPQCDDAEIVTFQYGAASCFDPFPPIDPNPYRFIGGQRYGEGWAQPKPDVKTFKTLRGFQTLYCPNDGRNCTSSYTDAKSGLTYFWDD